LILSYFKNEPGIKSVSDVWSKKPSFLYYLVNNLPASEYINNMNHLSDQNLFWETFAFTQFHQNIVQIYLGETRPMLNH